MSFINVKIPNWEKFNPRSDRANYSWLRFQNDFFSDQRIFVLNGDEQRLFLFILCEASKKNSETIRLVDQYISAILRLSEKQISQALLSLNAHGLIITAAESRHDDGREPAENRHDSPLRTNETYDTNERNDIAQPLVEPVLDFESLYGKYPRKVGKKAGLRVCRNRIKTQDDFDALSQAIDRYSEYLARGSVEPQFIKHFSTFMNNWEDWSDPATGSTAEFKKQDNVDWDYVFGVTDEPRKIHGSG